MIPDVHDVILLAEEAGRMISSGYSKVDDKDSKDNHVTDMDVTIQKFLRKELCELLPGSSFIGEELDQQDVSGEYHWIVDPIDGTTNFIRHIPASVTSIALAHNDEIIMGVVFNPHTNEMFYAVKGEGSFKNGKKINVSLKPIENAIYATSWGAYDKSQSHCAFRVSEKMYNICEDIRRLGAAAYELCKMAEGSIDVYFEPILYPWDHAAGGFILTEAGGFIDGIDGKPSLTGRAPYIAANCPESLEIIRKIVKEEY